MLNLLLFLQDSTEQIIQQGPNPAAALSPAASLSAAATHHASVLTALQHL
jgi:hypothetical protein